jgi:hypothetical protein
VNETMIMSQKSYHALLHDLRQQGVVTFGAQLRTFQGMKVFVSEHVPEGQCFIVSDPASIHQFQPKVVIRPQSTMPAAWARLLLSHCDVRVTESSMDLQYEITLRQGERIVGVIVIPHEDLAYRTMPWHWWTGQAVQGDLANLGKVLGFLGASWLDLELST